MAATWIKERQTIPPIDFYELMEALVPEGILKEEILDLLERKKAGEELDLEQRIPAIHHFLDSEIERLEAYAKTLPPRIGDPTDKLDSLFRETLEQVWK